MRYILLITGLWATVLGSTAAQTPAPTGTTGKATTPAMAGAAMVDASGRTVGQARLQQTPHGVLLLLELRNTTPGVHALHIHDIGKCDAPSFESAGDHVAFRGQQHGFLNVNGPHAGDLPNVHVPTSTELAVEFLIPAVTVDSGPRSLLDANGAALIIHAGKDDYASHPAGAAGDRLACGPIVRQ
jgi:Cu-Zn family superoxide dismutase